MGRKINLLISTMVVLFANSLFADIVLPNGEPDPAYSAFYAWYKADSGVIATDSLPADHNDQVAKWQDALGDSNRDLDNVVGPSGILVYKTNVLNGKPVIDFPNGKGIRAIESKWGVIDPPNTYFIVAIQDNRNANDYFFDGANSAKRNLLAGAAIDGRSWIINGGIQLSTGPIVEGEYFAHCVVINGTDSSHYVNGRLWGQGDTGGTLSLGGLVLGIHSNTAGNALDGAIAEVLVYDGVLTDEERHAIEQYLIVKYDLVADRSSGTLAHKYDGSDITVTGPNNVVVSWNDQVGDWDLSGPAEPNEHMRPQTVSMAFSTGDHNVVSFDGIDDYLRYVEVDGNDWQLQPSTTFLVGKRSVLGQSRYWFDGVSADARNLLYSSLLEGEYINRMYGGHYHLDALKADVEMWQIYSCIFDGFWSELYVDGYFEGTGYVGTHLLSGLTVGASYDLNGNNVDGEIAEILIYEGALDDTARESVEASLMAKYGIKPTCGAGYTVYFDFDFNEDCKIDLADFSIFAVQWLKCSDPGDSNCSGAYQN